MNVLRTVAVGAALTGIAFGAFAQAPAQPQPQRPAAQPQRPAQPQQRPAQAPAAQPAAPAQPGQDGPLVVKLKANEQQVWTKVCGRDQASNREICYTTRDFVSDQNQPVVAIAIYDVKGDPNKMVRFILPLGLMLAPGIRFAADQNQPTPGVFAICLPNGCFAEASVRDDLINALKRGNTLNVSVQNQVGREVTFQLPLADFGKAFDGAPIDPNVLAEQQRQAEEAQRQQEQMRNQLQNQAPGAVVPVTPPAAQPNAPRP